MAKARASTQMATSTRWAEQLRPVNDWGDGQHIHPARCFLTVDQGLRSDRSVLKPSMKRHCLQGMWRAGRRHGLGLCLFADGVRFYGHWRDDAWCQTAAHPRLCRATGDGLERAVAGRQATFLLQVRHPYGRSGQFGLCATEVRWECTLMCMCRRVMRLVSHG